jgi:hypothetical protein
MRNFVETCLGGDPLLPEMTHRSPREARAGRHCCWSAPMASGGVAARRSIARLVRNSGVPLNTALQAITEFAVAARRGRRQHLRP